MIELRAHHLLCMLTFAGKGYSPSFVARFENVAKAINRGEPVRIVSGPDELCACVIAEDPKPHCYKASVIKRDTQAAHDIGAKLGIVIEPGAIIDLPRSTIEAMRDWFRSGEIRQACIGCQWFDLCTDLSNADFENCRLDGA